MRYLDEFRDPELAQNLFADIAARTLPAASQLKPSARWVSTGSM